jgi:predicted dehydrogenase
MQPTDQSLDRRTFVKAASAAGIGAVAQGPGPLFAFNGAPNEKVVVAAIGVNSRGDQVSQVFGRTANAEVGYVVDVDSRATAKTIDAVSRVQGRAPKGLKDFRRALEDPQVDAVMIATPDHWHTPMAIMALQAGKHVYLEKPVGHNAREGELLVAAQARHRRLVQLGTQQRSAPRSMEVVQKIREGAIGRAYLGRTWYTNSRGTIGRGKPAPVPDWLDYELWQGPAPRRPFRDNLVHYNWHWFRHWGTGEIVNNGTHEVDVARWALGVDYPIRVSSGGGRYHYRDDWEFPDTQDATFDFADGKTITWEGRSCNAFPIDGKERGTSIHGTNGTVVMDRNGYTMYDAKNKKIAESIGNESASGTDLRAVDTMTDAHVLNFIEGIRSGATLNQPIDSGHKSVLLCHLGNIAQQLGRSLAIDPKTGRIRNDPEALKHWGRTYEKGWTPSV